MDDFAIARGLHILAVVMWVGGVAFVTTVATPAIRAMHAPAQRLSAFHQFESRFVWQARLWVLLAGASGIWMVVRAHLWARFTDLHLWWMHAMAALWAVFMLMLFVVEPLFLHKRLLASPAPEKDFDKLEIVHRILLALLAITVLGAGLGTHGGL